MTSFGIIAGVASILGLVASVLAFVQAKRASAAAKEARDGIILRTLADEFELACTRIDQLLDFIAHGRLAEAALRAGELASTLSEIPYRRRAYLNQARRNDLIVAKQQIEILERELSTGRDQLLSPEQKTRFMTRCYEIRETLRKNLGTIKGEMEK